MAVLYGNDAFAILVLSTKEQCSSFFEKGFRFPENLFQSCSIENVQNFQWLSHENMPMSQKKTILNQYSFLEDPMFFLLDLKWNL